MKSNWQSMRESWVSKVKPTVQAKLSAAAEVAQESGSRLRKGMIETKETLSVKTSQAARKAAESSKQALEKLEMLDWRNRGMMYKGVFGVPLEVTTQRQGGGRLVPRIIIKCVDFLIVSGLTYEYLFKDEGSPRDLQALVDAFNQDREASIPPGTSPATVGALIKHYFSVLPEPVLTWALYDDIVDAHGSSFRRLREIMGALPPANRATLECITALLLRVSKKSSLNKMDAHRLAIEFAPVLLWPKPTAGASISRRGATQAAENNGMAASLTAIFRAVQLNGDDTRKDHPEDGDDYPAQIPLEDEPSSAEFSVIAAVQTLIERHDVIFADAAEEIWRSMGV
ncbi:hypothetical protein CBR_g12377 [Chara braunii]|uniref:Rho-GAP domain-containing protein n=1 Tax=Chara braunii TaxID=69332 RepID=A0A388KRW6_CHABU|nr:hypothetical protein CBR_g12377 [Chara braunii]|eukprot:GBG72810.1 hypothetical protein CBR_g12377 [Chara braunii]